MLKNKHSLHVGITCISNSFFLHLKVQGKLTHEDYKTITPFIDDTISSIKDDAKINVFLDAKELEGWELRAAWDDFKIGVKHKQDFGKIAIYGNKNWQEIISKTANWFLSGKVEYFYNRDEAINWLLG